jgi:hypothetical protein
MGLSQTISFKYDNKKSLESFIKGFSVAYLINTDKGFFIISDDVQSFSFEVHIKPFGLYTHRSGEYFKFLGVLVESLSGEYGLLEIEDD